jgi:hypothetical protein
MSRFALLFAAFGLVTGVIPARAAAEEKPERLVKVGRQRIVGTPVMSTAPRGIHVWLEDGWYCVGAVTALPVGSKQKLRRTFSVAVRSTKKIDEASFDGWKKQSGGSDGIVATVQVGPDPKIMKFKTEGEVMVSNATAEGEPVQIYLGPLGKTGGPIVRIGRF